MPAKKRFPFFFQVASNVPAGTLVSSTTTRRLSVSGYFQARLTALGSFPDNCNHHKSAMPQQTAGL
jgi:hypothetical protein